MVFPNFSSSARASFVIRSSTWFKNSPRPFIKLRSYHLVHYRKTLRPVLSPIQKMSASTRQQPAWEPPPPADSNLKLPPLQIWNSLTRSKTLFVPIDWKNRRVKWYACGPTVYDDAHLGHARNYVSTDIIRRIMRDYFKFDLDFVMNITDVDDKIILRGRQQHLLAEFLNPETRRKDSVSVFDTALAALSAYLTKNLPLISSDTKPNEVESQITKNYGAILDGGSLEGGSPGDKEAKIKMHIKTVLAASRTVDSLSMTVSIPNESLKDVEDILLLYIDSLYGHTIDASDHSIFTKLTKKFEDRFMEDMRALNCLDPDHVTRVTEYSSEIVNFVQKVLDNGFAYTTSDGSIYFDIEAFEAAQNNYARLEPWNRNDKDLQADGEGSLIKKSTEKKSDADFAIWKSSKPGEPSWPSPWGKGRPGWHIECSAMASDKFGSKMDIHSGGIDLAFPHHDNELAQSEAYWIDKSHNHQHQWVNYFIHMGHLSIQGSKMSKSLKNFTTIREALSQRVWTPRGLRIVFLLGGWRDGIEITDDLVKAGSSWEDKLNNFFIKANDVLDGTSVEGIVKVNQHLDEALRKASDDTFTCLCDSFNTPAAMVNISELVSVYNSEDRLAIASETTRNLAHWITSMINIFGLNGETSPDDKAIGWSGIGIPEEAKPYLIPLSRLRDSLRQKARSSDGLNIDQLRQLTKPTTEIPETDKPDQNPYAAALANFHSRLDQTHDSPTLSTTVLHLCDQIRDTDLWTLGIYLEDRDGGHPALIRPVTKELRAARADREERDRHKQRAKAERGQEAAAKADRARLDPKVMFRTEEFAEWDADGVPLRDRAGAEIPKSRGKRLRKEWERQKRLYEGWVARNED